MSRYKSTPELEGMKNALSRAYQRQTELETANHDANFLKSPKLAEYIADHIGDEDVDMLIKGQETILRTAIKNLTDVTMEYLSPEQTKQENDRMRTDYNKKIAALDAKISTLASNKKEKETLLTENQAQKEKNDAAIEGVMDLLNESNTDLTKLPKGTLKKKAIEILESQEIEKTLLGWLYETPTTTETEGLLQAIRQQHDDLNPIPTQPFPTESITVLEAFLNSTLEDQVIDRLKELYKKAIKDGHGALCYTHALDLLNKFKDELIQKQYSSVHKTELSLTETMEALERLTKDIEADKKSVIETKVGALFPIGDIKDGKAESYKTKYCCKS